MKKLMKITIAAELLFLVVGGITGCKPTPQDFTKPWVITQQFHSMANRDNERTYYYLTAKGDEHSFEACDTCYVIGQVIE